MSENQDENRYIKPDELLAGLIKPRLTLCVIISFAAHIVLLLVLSISFLSDCAKYHTVKVKDAKKIEAKALADKAEEQRKAEALKRAEEAAQKKAAEDKTKAENAKKQEAKTALEQQQKSPTLKALNETSNDRPANSSMNLDLDLL